MGLVAAFACSFTAVAGIGFWGGTGRWGVSPPKFGIFLMFPCFLGS